MTAQRTRTVSYESIEPSDGRWAATVLVPRLVIVEGYEPTPFETTRPRQFPIIDRIAVVGDVTITDSDGSQRHVWSGRVYNMLTGPRVEEQP